MIFNFFFILWFFLPAGIANTVPVFAAKLPLLRNFSYPLDGYKYFRKQRILGDHKTIRGFIVGIFCAILVVYGERYLYMHNALIKTTVPINYISVNPLLLGLLLGLGGLGGDSAKSFFKRQLGIPPGHTWFPFDQLDYIIGAIAMTFFYIPLDWFDYFLAIVLWFILHLITAAVGYSIKLKETLI